MRIIHPRALRLNFIRLPVQRRRAALGVIMELRIGDRTNLTLCFGLPCRANDATHLIRDDDATTGDRLVVHLMLSHRGILFALLLRHVLRVEGVEGLNLIVILRHVAEVDDPLRPHDRHHL